MIIYIDMDGVLCDYNSAYKAALSHQPHILYPQSEYGFYIGLKPLEHAIESVNKLIQSPAYDVYILTSPSVKNPACYIEKRLWVEKYFDLDLARKFIISPNKGLFKGDILIDDHITGWGQENFEGEVWHFGGEQFPNWHSILKKLNL